MGNTAIPLVMDALVAKARAALTGITVYDGFGVSEESGDYLMVGVEDPDSADASYSADSSQAAVTMGTNRSRDERGDIACIALSWNGNGDQKAARDAAFATVAALEDMCRADPSLGITAYPLLVAEYGTDQRLRQNQDEAGAEAAVFFSIHFRARL